MQPDSDGPETFQAFPVTTDRPVSSTSTAQQAFSSFDFAAFQASTTDQTYAEAKTKEAQLQQAAQYFLSSSDDDGGSDGDEPRERSSNAADARPSDTKKKRKRKDRKHRRERDAKLPRTEAEKIIDIEKREAASGKLTRSFKQGQWLAGDAASGFYIDTHADKDNLAFEGLYRMNIAAYHRLDPTKVAAGTQPRTGYAYSVRSLNGEVDDERQRGSRGKRRRYFLAAVLRREQDAHLKRLHVHSLRPLNAAHGRQPSGSRLSLPMPTFMPLAGEHEQPGRAAPDESALEEENSGETAEQYMMRRIKTWNVAVRERPHELQLWLDFAAFQDEISKGVRGRRVSEAAVAEKKISILEQALKYHPGSDELLLALLTAAETVLSPDDMLERWQSIVRQHSSSGRLWRAYTAWQRTRFASFTVSSMQQAHWQALAALRRERGRRRREGAPDEVVAACERDILVLLLEYLQMQMQSGHTERAVACIQALLEFNCFSPDFPDIFSKQRAFREFWMGGSPLIGDEGAAGWSASMLQAAATSLAHVPAEVDAIEEPIEDPQPGGWGGWEELPPAEPAQQDAPIDDAPMDLEEGELDEDAEAEFAFEEEEESEEALMAQLGLKLEQELAQLDTGKGLDAGMAAKWGAEEAKREAMEWQPIRSMQLTEEQADVPTARIIDIEDIEDFLIDLGCEEVREDLVLCLLGLLGLDLIGADCSNTFASMQQRSLDDSSSAALSPLLPAWHPHGIPAQAPLNTSSADSPSDSNPPALLTTHSSWILPQPTFAHMSEGLKTSERPAGEACAAAQRGKQLPLAWYLASEDRRLFVQRLLLLGPFQDSCYFAEALLDVIAASTPNATDDTSSGEQRLEEMRALLAERREHVPLWHAYGQQLYKAGQAKAARKVYSTLLASLPGMPQAYVKYAPPVVLACARAELRQASKDSQQRALHALMWLGTGGPYTRFKAQEKVQRPSEPWSSDWLLQARRGYQAMLSERLAAPTGQLASASGALVSCAAFFELLLPAAGGPAAAEILGDKAEGTAAAVAIYEQALAAAPVEVRKHSAVHEGLTWELCCMLAQQCCAGSPVASPKRARSSILEALQVYPASARLMALLSILEMRAHTVSRLRRDLRALCDDSPSPQAWLMAARTEAQLAGSAHRVQAVLERALASKGGQQCGLLWRAALGFELSRGRPEAARRVFLRGIHACPWSKALWMDGLASIGEAVSAQERSELLDVMQDKEVYVRTDTYEILLAAVAEQQLL